MSKFVVGDRVKLSAFGLERLPNTRFDDGVVVGFGKKSFVVRVRRPNRKKMQEFHEDFLERREPR